MSMIKLSKAIASFMLGSNQMIETNKKVSIFKVRKENQYRISSTVFHQTN